MSSPSSWSTVRSIYRAAVVEDALKGKDAKSSIETAAAQIRTVAHAMSLNAYGESIGNGNAPASMWRWIPSTAPS